MNRLVARIGKEDLLIDNNTNSVGTVNQKLLKSEDSTLNDKDNMDDKFDDVLKVNKNINNDIYKKCEEAIKKSNEKQETNDENLINGYHYNSPFASILKAKTYNVEETVEEDNIVEQPDETEIEPRDDLMFDLFNLNMKDSSEQNLYEEKKLVNNKQKIINENNKVEVVENINEPDFSFQKDAELNYQDKFSDLRKVTVNKPAKNKFDITYNNDSPVTTVDLKNKLYASGYKIRTYQKLDSEDYYANKYYLNNKLNRDCSIITALIMIFIVGMMWIGFDEYVKLPFYAYIIMMVSFLILPIFSIVKYLSSKKSRKPAEFSFKLSILNAIMAYLIITVICLLVAFFAVGADIADISTLVCPLFYPMLMLLVLPIYVIVYQLLYVTKKYFIE